MASILIVDDEDDARDTISRFLTKRGYLVRGARNGREALIAVATTVPDLIILDVRMPEMSGLEFLQVIRSYLRWSSVPVILLTAYGDPGTISRARELGVNCFFLKANYTLVALLEGVRAVLADPGADCETQVAG